MKENTALPAHWSDTSLADILYPIREFIQHSASSGIVLLGATVLALILANTALAEGYHDLLHMSIGFSIGSVEVKYSVLHWINDGLMVVFFLLIGLEIKREVLVGELANRRAAILPVCAAVGGAIVPAIIYALFNAGGQGSAGWGIPMATDIAFTLGLLALLGKRVPFGLRVFLTAVAVVDDLIAILVIAVFYSSGISVVALGIGIGVLLLMLLANLLGIRYLIFYLVLGVVVWFAFLHSGIHATIAGVLIALTIPARNRIDPLPFLERARHLLDQFADSRLAPGQMLTDEMQQSVVAQLEDACEQVQAPLQRLEHALHGWVSFLIMPVFALANAGVTLSLGRLEPQHLTIVVGIVAGLVVGKPVGLLLTSWLITRIGLASLPPDIHWRHLVGASCLAGIGFTMSLFIASLALGENELLDGAKFGILIASLFAGGLGFFLLRRSPAAE